MAVSAPAYLKSLPFMAPDAPGVGLAVPQPAGAAALRPGDGRVTGVSYSRGLLWAGALPVFHPLQGQQGHMSMETYVY